MSALLFVASCDKNDNDDYIIQGKNIEGSENITSIMAVIERITQEQPTSEYSFPPERPVLELEPGMYVLEKPQLEIPDVIAEASFENGGFELRLPSVLSADLLTPVADEKIQGVMISTPSANWGFLNFALRWIGRNIHYRISFNDSHLQTDGIATKSAVYIYADRPVKLSGVATWTENSALLGMFTISVTYSNLALTAGWNKVCLEQSIDLDSKMLQSIYSNKNMSDCKWNLWHITFQRENNPGWRPE